MLKISIQGECPKQDFYIVLDYIDKLKTIGWFIQGKSRNDNEKTGMITFNYTLNKTK